MIRITVNGLDKVIDTMEKLSDVEKPVMEALHELMEEALEIATLRYSLQGNGNEDFHSEITVIPGGYMLTMSGEDIGFLEFGAGVFTEADEFYEDVPYPVYPGSWSESHEHSDNPNARYFAKNGFWWWNNIRYTGITPTRGMQQALDFIRDNVEEVVSEKINEWIGN